MSRARVVTTQRSKIKGSAVTVEQTRPVVPTHTPPALEKKRAIYEPATKAYFEEQYPGITDIKVLDCGSRGAHHPAIVD